MSKNKYWIAFSSIEQIDSNFIQKAFNHFGDIELVNVEGNNVYVQLKGHCSTCANAKMTLKNFVETKPNLDHTPYSNTLVDEQS